MCKTENRPYLTSIDHATNTVLVLRPNCGLWSCPECAVDNVRHWSQVLAAGVVHMQENGETVKFITLTSHEKLKDFKQTYDVWGKAWKKLSTKLTREHGKMTYGMIPERHKNGRLHMHMLCNYPGSKRWLKDNARECGLGYMVDVQNVGGVGSVVNYATKYMSKSLVEWDERIRRVRLSRDWHRGTEEFASMREWECFKSEAMYLKEIASLIELGFRPVDIRSGVVLPSWDYTLK